MLFFTLPYCILPYLAILDTDTGSHHIHNVEEKSLHTHTLYCTLRTCLLASSPTSIHRLDSCLIIDLHSVSMRRLSRNLLHSGWRAPARLAADTNGYEYLMSVSMEMGYGYGDPHAASPA